MAPLNTTQQGRIAEDAAYRYLQQQGLRLLERNFRSPVGEIDLIMKDGDIIVFIEVRYRSSNQVTSAQETIDYRKCRRIIKAGNHYLQKHRLCNMALCRFDVVVLLQGLNADAIEWIKNAFET